MASRITKVHLLNVPLENDYKHTLYFNSISSQTEYFLSKKKHSFTNMSYQRKEGYIRVDKDYDQLSGCNYIMYQNTDYSSKWYYAFITEIRYISDDVSWIFFETDCIQTWYFDYIIKPSFVEREHVSDDTIGLHTVPELLETGEYICNNKFEDSRGERLYICMAVSDLVEKRVQIKGDLYGGVYSGLKYYCYSPIKLGIEALNKRINEYDSDAKAEAINSLFMIPKWIKDSNSPPPDGSDLIEGELSTSDTPSSYTIPIEKQRTVNGFTPRNNKLLTYPYNYLYVSNNAGASAIYHYEHFSDSTCNFEVKGVICPGCSIRMNPLNYKGEPINNDEGINGGKYAICCWNSDTYTNWLTQNSINIGIDMAVGGAKVIGGAFMMATGAGAGVGIASVGSGLSDITGTLTQVYQHSLVPDQVKGNTNGGDIMTASGQNKFMFYSMSVKREYAQIIDNYFTMFGYKVNRVKTPNTHHRSRWWYTKTIDINIDGAIPNKDMKVIKEAYNNGITFWRNGNEIGDYSLTNEIKNIV